MYNKKIINPSWGAKNDKYTRQYKGYNKNNFTADLSEIFHNIDFDQDSDDVNKMYMNWKNRFVFVANMHAPPITRRVRSEYTPWLRKDIMKETRTRDYLKKKAVKTVSVYMQQAYKKARNEVTKKIKNVKRNTLFTISKKNTNNPQEM